MTLFMVELLVTISIIFMYKKLVNFPTPFCLSLCLSLSVCLCLSLSLPLSLSLSLSYSLSLYVSLPPSLPLSLPLFSSLLTSFLSFPFPLVWSTCHSFIFCVCLTSSFFLSVCPSSPPPPPPFSLSPLSSSLSLSPFLLSSNDYRTMDENICLLKFADDTTLHGLLSNSEEAYRSEVNRFCEWCKNNHLTLNVDKTKELVFDYRRKKEPLTPLLIDGKIVSIVDSYKYLGLKIDSKLNWSNHAHDVCKKVNQRLYFLRKLRSFKVNPEILLLFYRATIESIITYGINCWGSSIMTKDKERINRLIRKSEKIVKRTLTQIDCLYEDHAVKKAKTILKELTHPLNKQFLLSSRSGKIIQPIAKTERYRRSFVPSASALLRRLKSWDT